jgi:hypothetical protein
MRPISSYEYSLPRRFWENLWPTDQTGRICSWPILTKKRPFPFNVPCRLQLGLVGYGQWQTTDKDGPHITPEQAVAHYRVNALGFTANAVLPEQKVSVGLKYFREFECRSTFQGYTLQISADLPRLRSKRARVPLGSSRFRAAG